ncbi:peptide deformylase [Candidatus Saccharibacteria bacterium]|nr:peptide deformylase [Candidatus Saccharibacteria bacterium]
MSAKDSIIVLPDKNLRLKSRRVPVITPQVRRVIKDMITATVDWEDSREHEVGVALAAIQIDQPYRVVIVRNDFENKQDKTFSIFINPEIIKLEGEIEDDYEGCLSVTDIYGKVPRYNKARLRALDENGQPVRVKVSGFLARVFQHEIDHTNGIMFIDHIKDKKDAFYKLTDDGKLKKLDYETVKKQKIF